MSGTAPSLPLLDLSRFDAGPGERAAFLDELRAAVRDVGFFYLTGHGVPEELVEQVRQEARRFFALPLDDKLAIEMVKSRQFRGYTRAGWERTKGKPDWREQLDINAERDTLPEDPARPWARLQGPNQWPASQPILKPTLLEWQDRVTAVTIRLLEAFALALDQDEHVFEPIYAHRPNQHLKIIRYPGRAAGEGDQGVGAHKDSGFLTLLLQDPDQGGLQVELDGKWVDAEPLPGTFIVNVGEVLEMASNGYLRATNHRVVSPPAGKDRLSVAFFLGADLDATVPLLDLSPELAAEAKGPARDPDNPLFYEVGRNYLKGRLRSHPDVAEAHHADLLDQTSRAA